jgi:hypothetical protein
VSDQPQDWRQDWRQDIDFFPLDFFQLLSFELRTNLKPSHQFSETFGKTFGAKPDLVPILGSQDAAKRVLDRSNPDARKAKVLLKKLEEARLKGFGS